MRWVALALVAALGRVSAQVPAAPDRLRGTVLVSVRQDRQRVAGARVMLLSRPFADDERIGKPDRIVVTAAEGEGRAQILRGRPYTVWATVARDDGTTLITNVEEDVYAGMAVALAVEVDARPHLSVGVTSQEEWAAAQPLRVCVRARVVNVETYETVLDGDGTFLVPPLPGDRFDVDVLSRDGSRLLTRPLHWSSIAQRERIDLPLDPPTTVRVFVSDIDGVGVAGARILRNDGGRASRVAVTQPDGTADFLVPTPRFLRHGSPIHAGTLLAQADGYALGVLVPWTATSATTPSGLAPHWCATLSRADWFTGRCRIGEQPAARLTIVGLCTIHGRDQASPLPGYRPPKVAYRHVTTTGADGRFTLPPAQGGVPPMVVVVLSETQLHALPEAWAENGLSPVVLGACEAATPGLGADLDLRALEAIELQVQQPGGLPAELAKVSFVPDAEVHRLGVRPERSSADAHVRSSLRADRQGRLRFLRGSEVFALYAQHADASALIDVVSAARRERLQVQTVTVPLRPKIELRGQIVAADGKPAAAAPLMLGIYLDRAGLNAPAAEESELEPVDPSRARAVEIRDFMRVRSLYALLGKGVSWSVRVDQNGHFKCLVDDLDVEFEFQRATGLMQGTPITRVRPREQVGRDLRLVLPK